MDLEVINQRLRKMNIPPITNQEWQTEVGIFHKKIEAIDWAEEQREAYAQELCYKASEDKIMSTQERKAEIATIKIKLLQDQHWLERAILAIYARQTTDEKIQQNTHLDNSRGFSSPDAHLGSYMARWLLQGNHLSGGYVAKARKIMPKYAGQLAEIAAQRRAEKEALQARAG